MRYTGECYPPIFRISAGGNVGHRILVIFRGNRAVVVENVRGSRIGSAVPFADARSENLAANLRRFIIGVVDGGGVRSVYREFRSYTYGLGCRVARAEVHCTRRFMCGIAYRNGWVEIGIDPVSVRFRFVAYLPGADGFGVEYRVIGLDNEVLIHRGCVAVKALGRADIARWWG